MGIKKLLVGWLRKITIWLNRYYGEADILHFKSKNGKYIYLVIIGHHCPDEKKFYTIFPESTRINEKEFDRLYKKGVKIVCVGDDADINELEATEEKPDLKVLPCHPDHKNIQAEKA